MEKPPVSVLSLTPPCTPTAPGLTGKLTAEDLLQLTEMGAKP